MKEYHDASERLSIELSDNCNDFMLYAQRLDKIFGITPIKKIDGLEQRYWDYTIKETTLVLHADTFMGVSIHIEDGTHEDLLRQVAEKCLMSPPDVLHKLTSTLNQITKVQYNQDENTISIEPVDDDGFTVWLSIEKELYTVGYNGWHEEFADPHQAIDCFLVGLGNQCRLKQTSRGKHSYSWAAQVKHDGQWHTISLTHQLFFKFWQKKTIVYLQNHMINNSDINY